MKKLVGHRQRFWESLEIRQLLSTIYVDAGLAAGTHDGTSWASAYTDLQQALTTASAGDQIDVAGGTYKPTTSADRTATFQPQSGVAVYGGFAGSAATDPATRDPASYPTILSGDIGTIGDVTDNSYHVVTASGFDVPTILDGFTITHGNADGNSSGGGGGIYILHASPSINDCIIEQNRSDSSIGYDPGGGIYSYGAATITNCAFYGNVASATNANPPLAGGYGGAIFLETASASINNSIFVGNTAGWGGAIYRVNDYAASSASMDNCTFTANVAKVEGGAVFDPTLSTMLDNSILWGDTAPTRTEISDGPYSAGTTSSKYDDIAGGYPGAGNINVDPKFIRNPSPGTDGIWGTADDDYGNLQLQQTSPAIDAGNNTAVPGSIPTDFAGGNRFVDVPTVADTGAGASPIVDMGAYETVPTIAAYPGGPYRVVSGGSITLNGSGLSNVPGDLQYAWDFTGNGLFTDATGAQPTFTAPASAAPGPIVVSLRVTNANGGSDVENTTINVVPSVVYVDPSALGANNGLNWTNALTSFTDALTQSAAGQTIRLAQGVYYPTTTQDRTATFNIPNGVEIDGGYGGFWAATPDTQRLDPNLTVLSGNIGNTKSAQDDSYHVVTLDSAGSGTVLDGLTIRDGYANGTGSQANGGGFYLTSSSPTLRHCFILDNFAQSGGGGFYCQSSSAPNITDCIIADNSAQGDGGAIRNDHSSPVIADNEITKNSAIAPTGNVARGGAIANFNGSAPSITKCSIDGNHADSGGAIYNNSSNPSFADCTFIDNSTSGASAQGGAILNDASSPTLTNCTFTANSAAVGGGMYDSNSSIPTLINCIFWGDAPGPAHQRNRQRRRQRQRLLQRHPGRVHRPGKSQRRPQIPRQCFRRRRWNLGNHR